MREIVVIAHNIRSAHNVGSLLRTAEGLGVSKVYLSGYTPYPICQNDERLPHIANKVGAQIHKTALGAEKALDWQHPDDISQTISDLKGQGYTIAALEQSAGSTPLPSLKPGPKIALLLGSEIGGLDKKLLKQCDDCLEIPMFGKKESFNVVQAAAMALYHLTFAPP